MDVTTHTSTSFGSSDRPLRRYIALRSALDRVMDSARQSGIDGHVLREKLVHTWAVYVMNMHRLAGVVIRYQERGKTSLIELGQTDKELSTEAESRLTNGLDHPAYTDIGDRLFIRKA